jgi:hypothetical protein
MPTLHPSRTLPQAPVLRPLAPLLDAYKTLQKLVLRDASLKKRHEPDIIQALRDVERWLSEARVAKIAAEDRAGWDIGPREREERDVQRHNITGEGAEDHDESDAAEAWALNCLCDALLEPGTLVPASKKLSLRILSVGMVLIRHSGNGSCPPERFFLRWPWSRSGRHCCNTFTLFTQHLLTPSRTASWLIFYHRWKKDNALSPLMMPCSRHGPPGS